jgi:hypothetical protein
MEAGCTLSLEHVYCFQIGCENCYKIGRTKNPPNERMRGLATGSRFKLQLYKDIETGDPTGLESYIHALLDPKRAENGEFFNVTREELEEAVGKAEAFVREHQPLLRQAKLLCRKRPTDTLLEPTREMLDIYRELRELRREKFLVERRIELLASKVQIAIGENLGMKGVASWKWVERWPMDTKRFQKEHEALYEEYKRDSSSRMFLLEQVDLAKDMDQDDPE